MVLGDIPPNRKGFFLVLDGIDGCGKSTQSRLLFNQFAKSAIQVHLTAEPSSGDIGKILRKVLKDPTTHASLDALLFAADRIDHCTREILPQLKKGKIVISDRYLDSSLIYQSIQGKQQGVTLDWIATLNQFAIEPDLTIIFDMDPRISLKRREIQNAIDAEDLEKFEKLAFQQQIRSKFQEIVTKAEAQGKKNYLLIKADLPREEIFAKILKEISPKLKEKGIM